MSELTFEATSRTVQTASGTLHYHEAGAGRPLLLLHGSGPGVSAWANFRGNYAAFAAQFRTLALDLPGFGGSSPTEDNPMAVGPGAVIEFLDALGLDSVAIVGNSMGGAVGSRVAADHPERVERLVTIGGVGIPLFSASPPEGIKLLVDFVENPTKQRLVTWMESMVYDPAILTDEFVDIRWQTASRDDVLTSIRKMYNRDLLKAMHDRLFGIAQVEHLERIACPTLVTWGCDDRVTPLDGALVPMRLLRKGELHVFYNCGHWAMIERQAEFESVVLAFLSRAAD